AWDTASVPNGIYTISARAVDGAGNASIATAVTVWVNNTPAPPSVVALGTLNGHTVFGDESHAIVSWLPQDSAYGTAAEIAWDFLLNRVPLDRNGLPAYLTNSYLLIGSLAPSGWMHNPAHLYASVIESALAYYAYSGDARVITLARSMADYHLAHGRTPAEGWAWSGVPYASGCGNCTSYDGTGTLDTAGHIEPDKVGELGVSLIRLFQFTGEPRYRDAAIDFANALAARIRPGNATQSPWPFRVNALTNVATEEYSANVIKPIALFDELIRLNLGNPTLYQSARATALDWLLAFPMRNNQWSNYFEDVPVQSTLWNWNQYIPMETAYYLMLHPEHDPEWRAHVPALIEWVEREFGDPQFGANAIREQKIFHFAMGSHTSRYAAVNALYHELTGDAAAREKAYRALNWATYMISDTPQGQIIDGPEVRNVWFTDGYGDYVRHFMRALGAIPEWSSQTGSRLTRFTSVVTSIAYAPGEIAYTTADADGTEVLKVDFLPREVTADGVVLPQRSDPAAPGWMFDASRGVLRIRHPGTAVRVVGRPRTADVTPPVVLVTAPAGGTTVSGTLTIAADATDDVGVLSVQFFIDGAPVGAPDTLAPYTLEWDSVKVADGTHSVVAVAKDTSGHETASAAVTVTVDNPDERVITFDDAVHSQPLSGEYPTGVVNWGVDAWFLSGPWGQFTTNSISFNGAGITEAPFTFLTPKRLLSVKAFNGGSVATTVTLSCAGNPAVSTALAPNELLQITTGWTANCSTVTIASTNGWDTNFDDLVYDEAQAQ
ncbi:MAG TPA: Ig-like domain-containing protein, partial [Vicinamibacterales bacterium]|nr:Ig-like domain-containing protein [Vicinamibacterales bacterium]